MIVVMRKHDSGFPVAVLYDRIVAIEAVESEKTSVRMDTGYEIAVSDGCEALVAKWEDHAKRTVLAKHQSQRLELELPSPPTLGDLIGAFDTLGDAVESHLETMKRKKTDKLKLALSVLKEVKI